MASQPLENATFEELLQQTREGSDGAARELVRQYGHHVIRAIRRNLSHEIRGKFDSDDFAQAVWVSFFTAPEQLDGVTEPRQLVGLLARMARNKVIDEVRRRLMTEKYAVRREQSLEEPVEDESQFRSSEATPSQFAMARERWVQMLAAQPELYRKIMRLKLMGKSNRSVATRLQVSERTVKRVIDRLTEAEANE